MDISGMMDGFLASTLGQALLSPIMRLGAITEQTYWLTYLGSMATAAIYYLWSRRKRFTSLKGVAAYVMPKKLLLHRSTRLDFSLFLVGSIYLTLQGSILLGSIETAKKVGEGLTWLFGPGAETAPTNLLVSLLTPIALFLALELGYWCGHYLLHRYEWLWEFHKVHHSAEVMTPLTEWRQHPLELLIIPVAMNLAVGLVYGTILWGFGPEAPLVPLWNVVTILAVFFFTLLHLRHSHVKMQFPSWLGRLLQSPAHHHIHHSTEARHFNKNLGYCLSVWDWAFGTLYLPEKGQKIQFGIGEEVAYQKFGECMVEPVKKLGRRVGKKRSPD